MTPLCLGRDPEWWGFNHDGARLALAICRRCPAAGECRDDEPEPLGVIRAGVAYSDEGRALPLCSTCGYPNARVGFGSDERCERCMPGLTRWRTDIARWAGEGLSDIQIGRRVGATRRQVADFRRKQTSVPIREVA
ncbi:hypothetical protein [Paractinoplanes toevensis]|uniref:4Fe-4S Wbl-type domain-containing protein n=1 Tax=Paractinoplanes toevensis TaxID=571911 RepID=A0A919T6W2_9ACTN|nr:hypothetical protein [Actinoplanes toevensis]GIM88844.1 hypothetical protein Ato02nite_006370 [Actinoplanes toevensis]